MNLRQKQTLYHELAQFFHAGIGFSQAVESLLAETGRGAVRRALETLRDAVRAGADVPAAFARLRPAVGEMELAMLSAADRSGRLEEALNYLSTYFQQISEVRAGIAKQVLWPVVQLHLGVFLLALPVLLAANGGTGAYLRQTVGFLLVLYLVVAVVLGLALGLLRLGGRSAAMDQVLNALPLLGRVRRNLGLGRFCAVYEMQLSAGVNVMDALQAAARASRGAALQAAVARALPAVRAGEQVGPQLAASKAPLPSPLLRALRLGEETGRLDVELRNWAAYYQKAAVGGIDALSRWLPRLIYLLIAGYLGYRIVATYAGVLDSYRGLMED
ncbi:MAG: type II secretion system F family protein [Verrucomicrobia bacterium]|nr:type II secretion system F family protein [Verrucomicrobiota bacterium]